MLSYCSIPMRPFIAMLTDVLSHSLNKMEHLATVHYENGHYHLHTELKAIDESETQKKNPVEKTAQSKSNVNDSEQLFTLLKIKFPISSQTINLSYQIENTLLSGFKKIPFMPPKLA